MPNRTAWVLCSLLFAVSAHAQQPDGPPKRWSVGMAAGALHYSGGTSEEIDPDGAVRFYPYRPSPLGLVVEYGPSRLRVGLQLLYSEPGLAGTGTDQSDPGGAVTLVVENALKTYTIMPTVSVDLVRMHSGARLRPGLGLLLERWEIPLEPARNRVGGVGLLTLEVPLFGGFVASATGTFGVTPASPFKAEELPSPYRPTALWRRGITAVVSYRL
jgi:hypothetical protein